MNNIKTEFSIGDLENLSGIKAHTIRMWEKRYELLTPGRGESGMRRTYTLDELRKLLNVTLLTGHGFKISRVAAMDARQIEVLVTEVRSTRTDIAPVVHQYKLAMMTFDQASFIDMTEQLLSKMPFREVFMRYFLPLLEEIGLMWQTATIEPAHEHFVSNLIRMVVLQQTAASSRKIKKGQQPAFVLFLPFGEIHELGLLYLQYEITASGRNCIYLGSNMSLDSLTEVTRLFTGITYITYLTVTPEEKPLTEYIPALHGKIQRNGSALWVVGRKTMGLEIPESDTLRFFTSLSMSVEALSLAFAQESNSN
ncbi:MerR family transcriptional regulator [Flavobacterium album]|uniref:MerR family transcriptional regulator n=1 Tax=Flavobacterium album TaxID=2175091 RepID=A0A2S1R1E9_9FLAO|nr:MerR family transcriptional regulator [Flavobacterium album]AWH86500.1 MerR family transcriptional regulator [Flavobacterium album]